MMNSLHTLENRLRHIEDCSRVSPLSDAEAVALGDAYTACQAMIAQQPCRTLDDARVKLEMLIGAHQENEVWLTEWEEELLLSVLSVVVALNGGVQ